MQTIQEYQSKNSVLSDDLETVYEHDLLSKLIEVSKIQNKNLCLLKMKIKSQ